MSLQLLSSYYEGTTENLNLNIFINLYSYRKKSLFWLILALKEEQRWISHLPVSLSHLMLHWLLFSALFQFLLSKYGSYFAQFSHSNLLISQFSHSKLLNYVGILWCFELVNFRKKDIKTISPISRKYTISVPRSTPWKYPKTRSFLIN